MFSNINKFGDGRMELTYLQTMILFCLHKINGERTIYSIYHLLKGKKSSQTIQDTHLFHLQPLYQSYTNLSRNELDVQVEEFLSNQLLIRSSDQRYRVTAYGEKNLENALSRRPIPVFLNGWKYQRKADVFWERLSLSVQVISYLQNNDSKYMPIQRKVETLQWIKHFLKQNKLSRENLGLKLYAELVDILESDVSIEPELLVQRLSGYRSIGLTSTQVANMRNMEPAYYHYQFLNILHFLIGQIEANKLQFPILAQFLDHSQKTNLTFSTEKTYALLKQGYSVTDIMSIRRLKKSTIEDHLVELAIHMKEFSIDPYVSIEKQKQIQTAIKKLNSKQLKQIYHEVIVADYFEIRLVLARYGDGLCN
jgi:uncharacterized protein YpbB